MEISHNAPKWGAGPEAKTNLELVEEARRAGQDVTVDNDSHTDLAPRLSRALPQTLLGLSHERLMALLADRAERANVRRAVESDALPGAGYAGLVKHGRYGKFQKKSARFLADDRVHACVPGDVVEIEETRPLSARKRWRVRAVVTAARREG